MDPDKLQQQRISNAILLGRLTKWKFITTTSNVLWYKGRFQFINIVANTTLTFSRATSGITYVLKIK